VFVVRATIPDMRPEDIQVNVQGDWLTLRAASQSEPERNVVRNVVASALPPRSTTR
jgi:HSP20 family molecular chaperone IbpA